jgi:NAD(P)H-flavin reductase
MSTTSALQTPASPGAVLTQPAGGRTSPWLPRVVKIVEITPEVPGIWTYRLAFAEDDPASAGFSFAAGQFNMLYLPGIGEVAISISSDPAEPSRLLHTIRVAGNVTQAMVRMPLGESLGLRGPFGSSWPMASFKGNDIVLACGGVGLAPLRPAIYHIMKNRSDYGRVILLYGSRTPGDLLYGGEYDAWRDSDIEVEVTVDIGDAEWRGNIGVVPVLFYRLRLQAARTRVLTCGPEVMISFVIYEALARKIPKDHIYISMERNMACAMGHCGHCQLGPAFVCKDGPVFTFKQMEPYLHVEDF